MLFNELGHRLPKGAAVPTAPLSQPDPLDRPLQIAAHALMRHHRKFSALPPQKECHSDVHLQCFAGLRKGILEHLRRIE